MYCVKRKKIRQDDKSKKKRKKKSKNYNRRRKMFQWQFWKPSPRLQFVFF